LASIRLFFARGDFILGIGRLSRMEGFSMITHEQEIEIKNKMINEKNDRIIKLEMEIARLQSELEYINQLTGDTPNEQLRQNERPDRGIDYRYTRASPNRHTRPKRNHP
jgi:hypothetical protein